MKNFICRAWQIFFVIITMLSIVPLRKKCFEESLKKFIEKSDYVIQIDFWYFEKFISEKCRLDIFMEMCERLTAIDVDYFLKNFAKKLLQADA